MRTCLAAVLFVATAVMPAVADDVSALLHRQTQQFSDAGQRGQGHVMAQYLDDNLVFFNESGVRSTKADLSQDGAPAPGPNRTITTTDWTCELHGNVAVTSFVDVVEQGSPSHRLQAKFRSTETWLKEGAAWKMIGSETLTIHDDPPSITLDAKSLDQFAGDYIASSGLKIAFKRSGNELTASVNGGPQSAQKAETPDILFTPGRGSLRKVFQRNAQGKITGFILLGGSNDILFRRVG